MPSKRTPLTYYGGKTQIMDEVIAQFPPHRCYVEVFGGGGAVILHKAPSPVDVYNDIGNVAKFFKVLRDSGDELASLLTLTPYSYDEYMECVTGWPAMLESGNMVEWARMWFVTLNQSFKHEERKNTWRTGPSVNCATAWVNKVDSLEYTAKRLRTITIENADFDFIFDVYDGEDTLFYCDPPYISESRTTNNNYFNEMTMEHHFRFLHRVRTLKGQVVVSGFHHDMYKDFLSDWREVVIERKFQISNKSTIDTMRTKQEVLWIKEHNSGLWS